MLVDAVMKKSVNSAGKAWERTRLQVDIFYSRCSDGGEEEEVGLDSEVNVDVDVTAG